jgi:hypothetical protein
MVPILKKNFSFLLAFLLVTSVVLIADRNTSKAQTQIQADQLALSIIRQNPCNISIGDQSSGSAITNAQLGPQSRLCFVPGAATVTEIEVAADGGTPNVIVGRNHAGTITNLLSGALATAASGGIACSNTGGTLGLDGATTCTNTLQNTSLAQGDYIELVSGTAGGTAKLMTIHITYTLN